MPSLRTATLLLAITPALACVPPPDLPRDPRRIPPIAAAEPAGENPTSYCIQFRGEARQRSYAYDHVVHLDSTCHRTANCNVSTNVSPQVVIVAVEPGASLEVITLRGSENPEFAPIVQCSAGTR